MAIKNHRLQDSCFAPRYDDHTATITNWGIYLELDIYALFNLEFVEW